MANQPDAKKIHYLVEFDQKIDCSFINKLEDSQQKLSFNALKINYICIIENTDSQFFLVFLELKDEGGKTIPAISLQTPIK